MASRSGGGIAITVAIIGLIGTLSAAVIANWGTLFGGGADTSPEVPRQPGVTPAPTPAPSDGAASAEKTARQIAETMEWLEARCGSGIKLVVPFGAGSRTDQAARSFATALGNSGVRPIPLTINMPGVFIENGHFSVEKFNSWQRSDGTREGCLLAIVPADVGDRFPAPRFNVSLDTRTYSIALPPGTTSEISANWNTVFEKADDDPDFLRELRGLGLQAELIAME